MPTKFNFSLFKNLQSFIDGKSIYDSWNDRKSLYRAAHVLLYNFKLREANSQKVTYISLEV